MPVPGGAPPSARPAACCLLRPRNRAIVSSGGAGSKLPLFLATDCVLLRSSSISHGPTNGSINTEVRIGYRALWIIREPVDIGTAARRKTLTNSMERVAAKSRIFCPCSEPRFMTTIALIRHAATEWNEGSRVPSTDVPLSDGGRETVRSWKAPSRLNEFQWVSNPLRAVETANILAGAPHTERIIILWRWIGPSGKA